MGKISSNHFGKVIGCFLYFSFNDIESEEDSVLQKVFEPNVFMGQQPGSEGFVLGHNYSKVMEFSLPQTNIVIPEIIQKLSLGGALSLIEVLPVVPIG